MLLAIDIGNSNIKFGVFDGDELRLRFEFPTHSANSREALQKDLSRIDGYVSRAIICSVVPGVTADVAEAVKGLTGAEVAVFTSDVDIGFKVELQAPGTDRIVNAYSARSEYGSPCVVCSMGTALTIDVVDAAGTLIGGVIAPGVGPMAAAMKLVTAQLPEVETVRPEAILQTTTVGALQSGLMNGYLVMCTGLILQIVKEQDRELPVIATGGLADFVADASGVITVVDRDLTLKGLNRISAYLTSR